MDANLLPFFPIFNALVPGGKPPIGTTPPACIRASLDFVTAVEQKIDFSSIDAMSKMDTIQGVFVDNFGNAGRLLITSELTRHRLIITAGSLAFLPFLTSDNDAALLVAEFDGPATVMFINVPVPALIWVP